MRRITIDLQLRTLRFLREDGRLFVAAMPADMFPEPVNLHRVEVDVDTARVFVTMPGERATVELRREGQSVDDARAGRPLIYLDQNQWSTLAAARHGHRPVRDGEQDAALRLAELVDAEQVLLPVSAGHLVETTPLHGRPRIALAGTVLALSRGWQMRNPLLVRAEEIRRAMQGADPAASEVFAPRADGLFGNNLAPTADDAETPRDPAIPPELLGPMVPAILGIYESVIDERAIPDEGNAAQSAAERWAKGFAELGSSMRAANESAAMVRRVAGARMLADMIDDVVRVAHTEATTPEAVIDRLTAPDDPVSRMPSLAQMRQMLFGRLRNANQGWESNDLIDIMFLCCAAGYADVVVGERRAIGYLNQARQPAPRAKRTTSLRQTLQVLDDL